MMNRREFLKRTAKLAGLAGIYSLGAGAVQEAVAYGILPSIAALGGSSGGAVNTNFLTWDKTTLTGWGDSTNVYINLPRNTSAGGDDTGYGIFSGGDLVFVESGNLAGASGTPLTRAFDGSDDYMQSTAAFNNNFMAKDNPVFVMIHEFDTWAETEADQGITRLAADAGGNDVLYVIANNRLVRADFADGGVDHYTDYTTDAMPTTGTVIVYVEDDGANIKCGWHTERVGSWDDIPANQKSIKAQAISWAGLTFNNQTFILCSSVSTHYPAMKWHYTVFATKTLAQISA